MAMNIAFQNFQESQNKFEDHPPDGMPGTTGAVAMRENPIKVQVSICSQFQDSDDKIAAESKDGSSRGWTGRMSKTW